MSGFELHPRLAADTFVLGDLPLCRVLLMNDRNYPWLILVPRRAGMRETFELATPERERLWREVDGVAEILSTVFGPYKMNIAALGNQVAQLHLHCIARFRDDPAWPGPVWGAVPRVPYAPAERDRQIRRMGDALAPLQLQKAPD